MASRRIQVEVIAFLLLTLLMGWQIFVPPFVGLANNGDFGRIISRFSFEPVDHWADNFIYFQSQYRYTPPAYWNSEVPTSEVLLFAPCAWLARTFTGGRLDIRLQGAIHLAILLIGVALALTALRHKPLAVRGTLCVALVPVLSDVRYTSYLNSFYTDAAALLGLLILIAAGWHVLESEQSTACLVVASAGALLISTSKTQHAPVGLLWALALAWLAWRRSSWKYIAAALAVVVTCSAVAVWTPRAYSGPALFNVVFYKILPRSDQPLTDSARLGVLPPEQCLIGTHAFLPGSPCNDARWLDAFTRRVTPGRLVAFFVSRPSLTARILWSDLTVEAPQMRLRNLANYQRVDGFPAGTLARRFALWTDVRSWLIQTFPLHLPLLYLAAVGIGLALLVRGNQAAAGGLLLLCVCGVMSFLTAVLFDATETNRHLYIFHAITDALLVALAGIAAAALTNRRPAL